MKKDDFKVVRETVGKVKYVDCGVYAKINGKIIYKS